MLTQANIVQATHEERDNANPPIQIPLQKHGKNRFNIYCKDLLCNLMVEIEDGSIQLTFTSPPYYDQREYTKLKDKDQEKPPLGKEKTVKEYIDNLRKIFLEVYRVTKFRGSVFVNISDTYSCDKNNYVPELFCIMMSQIGFHKVNTIPWVKTNNRTRGTEDRRLLPSWEYLFHFVKKEAAKSDLPQEQKYLYKPFLYYPEDKKIKVKEIGSRRNKDGTKTEPKIIVSKAYKRLQDFFDKKRYFDIIETAAAGADSAFLNKQYNAEHEAPFPLQLSLYAIHTCSEIGDKTLDCFMGSGTFAVASMLFDREAYGYECEERHHNLCIRRCTDIETGLEELEKEPRAKRA